MNRGGAKDLTGRVHKTRVKGRSHSSKFKIVLHFAPRSPFSDWKSSFSNWKKANSRPILHQEAGNTRVQMHPMHPCCRRLCFFIKILKKMVEYKWCDQKMEKYAFEKSGKCIWIIFSLKTYFMSFPGNMTCFSCQILRKNTMDNVLQNNRNVKSFPDKTFQSHKRKKNENLNLPPFLT